MGGKPGTEGTEAAPPPRSPGDRVGRGSGRGGGGLGLAGLRRGAPRVMASWTSGSPPQK